MKQTTTAIIAFSLIALPAFASAAGLTTGVSAKVSALGIHASTTANVRLSARIANAKQRADQEIARRTSRMNALIARLNAAAHISSSDKATLVANMNSQISALASLQTQIGNDDSTSTLHADIQSITKSYRIFMLVVPQAAITAAADRVNDVSAMMTALGAKLDTRLASSSNASASAALTDMQAKVSSATSLSASAVAEIANLKPDNGDTTIEASNTAALKDARSKVQAAQQDLVAARKDISAILQTLRVSASATTSAAIKEQ